MEQLEKARRSSFRRWTRRATVGVFLLVSVIALVMRYGGKILVHSDPLPSHAEVAVMLDGPAEGVAARWDRVMSLLQQKRVDNVMISVQRVWVWGQWGPRLVQSYLDRTYGPAAKRIVLCEMNTDSTLEESTALRACLASRGWKSVLVVTSEYHTRRARHIWKKVLGKQFSLCVYGVRDDDFAADGWWRKRRYAKTWLLETTKLFWNYLTGT